MKVYVTCKFPNDPTVSLGILFYSALHICCSGAGFCVFSPYKRKSAPNNVIFLGMTMHAFFLVATLLTVSAEAILMWVTITKDLHRFWILHKDTNYNCPNAKTGLFGGAVSLPLDSALFRLTCQMLTLNARADCSEEDGSPGRYGKFIAIDHVDDDEGYP